MAKSETSFERFYIWRLSYLEGDFPELPGMTEEDELKMIDGFFSMTYEEDTATIRIWS